jgi:hypothetical protein
MSSLGRNGRFANQLFQYAFLRICAERRGATLETPAWAGQDLFGFQDAPLTRPGELRINGEEVPDPDLFLNRSDPIGDRVEFWGYFQYHSRHYRPHRDFLRRLFTLKPELRGFFHEVVEQIRATRRPLVAIHLRRGDYGHAQFFRAPARWYADWLETVPANAFVYLCSESPAELAGCFPGRQVLHAGLLPNLPPALAFALDFHVLTQADAVAISNSSFSFMAAMLNGRAKVFSRPDLEERRLLAFDPWNSPVLLSRRLQPGEQEELDAMDQNLSPMVGLRS